MPPGPDALPADPPFPGPEAATCVLVHPRVSEPSAELQSALAKQRIAVRRASSPFDALAQLCALARTSRSRPVILLLAHPTALDRPDLLLAAAQRYAPKAGCWVFDSTSSPRLRAATTEDAKSWTPHPVSRLIAQPEGKPLQSEITFIGPGFPRTPVVPEAAKPAARVEPKASPAAPPAPALKLAGSASPPPTGEPAASPLPSPAPAPAAPKPSSPITGPKFVGGSWDGGNSPFPGTTPGTTPRQLLSDEELAMLLADPPTRPHS
jgi:hypothetical protein